MNESDTCSQRAAVWSVQVSRDWSVVAVTAQLQEEEEYGEWAGFHRLLRFGQG